MNMTEQTTTPQLPSAPEYAPYKSGRFRLAMGLLPLDLQDWIEPDESMVVELAEKERLLRERHPEVFSVLPEAFDGSAEVFELLVAHLPARFPTLFKREGNLLHHLATLQTWDFTHRVCIHSILLDAWCRRICA